MTKMLALFSLLSVVKAEESSIMGSATVVRDALLYPFTLAPDPDVLVKGSSFKHYLASDVVDSVHEFKVDLG